MKLGELIKEYRYATRTGIRDLAREIGVSHSTLSRFERGYSIDSDTLKKILLWVL